jgi:hypothetical protein
MGSFGKFANGFVGPGPRPPVPGPQIGFVSQFPVPP